jgi:hypothetical protein
MFCKTKGNQEIESFRLDRLQLKLQGHHTKILTFSVIKIKVAKQSSKLLNKIKSKKKLDTIQLTNQEFSLLQTTMMQTRKERILKIEMKLTGEAQSSKVPL